MTTQTQYFPLRGSLDLAAAAVLINPGDALECVNFVPGLNGGYRFIGGYERFDGRAAPSVAQFWALEVSDTSGLTIGDILAGSSSAATSAVVAIPDLTTVIVTALLGSYQANETVNGVVVTEAELLLDSASDLESDQWRFAAANHYRAKIEAVPGSGPIRGVFRHLDKTYAFRDNDDGTECLVYQASSTGWQLLPLYSVLAFSSGSSEILAGNTITDDTSTAEVHRVLRTKGTWSGDAEGYLVIEPKTGSGLKAGAQLKVGATLSAIAKEDAEQIKFTAGGRFEFVSHNFQGSSEGYRVYGADGKNSAFEIDQAGFLVPLLSKDETDNPSFVQAHKSRLFLGFQNGQVHYSVTGEPWNYEASLGAGQIGLGAEVTGMSPQSGGVLAITTRRRTFILQGSANEDFQLIVAAESAGAFPYTLQTISEAFALDDRGIIQLSRTAAFGGFEEGAVTRKIQRLIDRLKPLAIASTVMRRLNQYWLFFSDGTGLACYPIASAEGASFLVTQFNLGRAVRCVCNAEDQTGAERILFGSDDGFVYELEKGTSFDGGEIEAFVRLPFNHFKSSRVRKRWRKLLLELEAEGPVNLAVTPDIDYSSPDVATQSTTEISAYGGGGYWDSDSWDLFSWDAEAVSVPSLRLTGTGTNIGFLIHHQSATTQPFTLQSLTIHYEPRRLER